MSFYGIRGHGLPRVDSTPPALGADPSVVVIFPDPAVVLIFIDPDENPVDPVRTPELKIVAGSTELISLTFGDLEQAPRQLTGADNFVFALYVDGTPGETPLLQSDNVAGGSGGIVLSVDAMSATLQLTQAQADLLREGVYVAQCNYRNSVSLDWRPCLRFHVHVSSGDVPKVV